MAFVASACVRVVMGLMLASALAVFGFFIGWMLWSPGWGPNVLLMVIALSVGASAGVGGFVAWVKLDSGRLVNLAFLALALLGGVAGAWVGSLYGQTTYQLGYPGPSRVATVLGAGIGANIVPFAASIYWAWRRREL